MTIVLHFEVSDLTTSNKEAVQRMIVAQVENQTEQDHILGYDIAAYMADCFKKAADCNKEAAIVEAKAIYPVETQAGKEFCHKGLYQQVQCEKLYDFSHRAAWIRSQSAVIKAKAVLDKAKVAQKATEEELRLKLKPVGEKLTFKFTPLDA